MSGKFTSTIQDLRTIAGQSSKEDLIAGGTGDRRGRQACFFSAMTHWRRLCPISQNSPRTNLDWCTANIPIVPDLDAVYTFDVKIAQDRGLTFHQTCSCAIILNNTMPSDALVEFNRNDSETEITTRHTSDTLIHFFGNRRKPSATIHGISSEKPDATIHGKSTKKPLGDNSDRAPNILCWSASARRTRSINSRRRTEKNVL